MTGFRTGAAETDFSEILPEDVATSLKSAAEVSMGTEISQSDLDNILLLIDQILSLTEYRTQLYNYLCSRMRAIAPNLTIMVGELVGARLIAHAGNLVNLAKQPASTIQILGAEKALFRALKTKHDTPKYGLIFHASLVGQASSKNKGKIARTLAAKTALALRYDALVGLTTRSGDSANVEIDEEGEVDTSAVGVKFREVVERRLRLLENRLDVTTPMRSASKQQKKFEFKAYPSFPYGTYKFSAPNYNADADVLMTEADLSPLLSKPSPTQEEKKKKKKDKTEDKEDSQKKKKRSRKELEDDEDEIAEQMIKQTKSKSVSESAATKKEKTKIAENHVLPPPY
jgi:nucleolar protein 58